MFAIYVRIASVGFIFCWKLMNVKLHFCNHIDSAWFPSLFFCFATKVHTMGKWAKSLKWKLATKIWHPPKKITNFSYYKPGQPNTQCGNFRIILPFRFLREINFGHFDPSKTAILTIWETLNFEFLRTFDIFKFGIYSKIKFQSLQNC